MSSDTVTFMITDVVDGPWMCTDRGPFANMDGVFVRQEHVDLSCYLWKSDTVISSNQHDVGRQ